MRWIRWVVIVCALLIVDTAVALCDPRPGMALDNSSAVQCHLLGEGSGYNKQVPPPGGTAVRMALNLAKIYGLDMVRGTFDLQVWLRMKWVDTRLAWDSKATGVTSLSVFGDNSDLETSQVWVPDIEMYNAVDSTYEFTRKDLAVYPSGTVVWSRPGRLNALCDQQGLQNFPFDKIKCRLSFGGWWLSEATQNLTFYTVSEDGTGAWSNENLPSLSFQQYTIKEVGQSRKNVKYACCEDGYPELSFHVIIVRATFYYTCRITVNILLTLSAFGVFFSDPMTGERLGFSMTMLLTLVAQEIVTSELLPVTNSVLWIQVINYLNLFFCYIAAVENFLILAIFWHCERDMFRANNPR